MGNLLRWDRSDPFKELEEIGQRLVRTYGRSPARLQVGREAIDISEDTKEYIIKAEIPQVEEKDVRVTLQEGVLTIHRESRKENLDWIERAYGTFVRTFSMPGGVAEDNLRSEFKDGTLWVHLPKTQITKPKPAEVKVA